MGDVCGMCAGCVLTASTSNLRSSRALQPCKRRRVSKTSICDGKQDCETVESLRGQRRQGQLRKDRAVVSVSAPRAYSNPTLPAATDLDGLDGSRCE